MSRVQATRSTVAARDADALEVLLATVVASRGWVNCYPGDEASLEAWTQPTSILSALGGRPVQPYAQVTVVTTPRLEVGILHPFGRLGPHGLVEHGCALPTGWRLLSDHARRGLTVAPTSDLGALARWCVGALEGLSSTSPSATWSVEVFSPRG